MSTKRPQKWQTIAMVNELLEMENSCLKAKVERLKQELLDMTKAYIQAGVKATLAQKTLENWEADESLEKESTEP